MKILSIGNSFSMDAHHYLHDLAKSAGVNFECYNLYIGGCELKRHWENYMNKSCDYELWINGKNDRMISLNEALEMEEWDVITLQQASGSSPKWETYEPYLSNLYTVIAALCPNSSVYIHKTWAYEKLEYRNIFSGNLTENQEKMYNDLSECYQKAADLIGVDIIPVGNVIQYLRENTEEFKDSEDSLFLTRDGYHLSFVYGRYAAALTWFSKLAGKSAKTVKYIPEHNGEKGDEKILDVIKEAVFKVLAK